MTKPKDYPEAIHPGPKIRALRERLDLTQDELEELSGVAKSTISRIEKGDQEPRLYQAHRLASALGVSVEALYSVDDDISPSPPPSSTGMTVGIPVLGTAHATHIDAPVIAHAMNGAVPRMTGDVKVLPVTVLGEGDYFALQLAPDAPFAGSLRGGDYLLFRRLRETEQVPDGAAVLISDGEESQLRRKQGQLLWPLTTDDPTVLILEALEGWRMIAVATTTFSRLVDSESRH